MTVTRSKQLYLGFIVALLLLGAVLDQAGYLASVRAATQTVLTSLQSALASTGQELEQYLEVSADVRTLQAKNAELETLANSLMVENIRLKELERENAALRQLLNYTRNNPQLTYETTTIFGRSIGRDPSNLLYFVYIDVGA